MHNIIRYRNRPYLPIEAQRQQSETHEDTLPTARTTDHVKNFHVDFRLKAKELSLYNAVINDAELSAIANIEAVKTSDQRLQALGMAVTIIKTMGEEGRAKTCAAAICHHFQGRQAVKLNVDPALHLRGIEFIRQFLDTDTFYDGLTYALGLRLGYDAKQNILDTHYINGFSTSWSARLALSGS